MGNRIERIKQWKKKQLSCNRQEKKMEDEETKKMLSEVKALEGRISELLAVANACRDNGICVDEFTVSDDNPNCLGLVLGKPLTCEEEFMYVGFNGKNGKGVFITDGREAGYSEIEFLKKVTISPFGKSRLPDLSDLAYFLGFFETFERRFYAYVDGVTAETPAEDGENRIWLIVNNAEEGRYAIEGAYASKDTAWARLDEIQAHEEGGEDYVCLPVVVT